MQIAGALILTDRDSRFPSNFITHHWIKTNGRNLIFPAAAAGAPVAFATVANDRKVRIGDIAAPTSLRPASMAGLAKLRAVPSRLNGRSGSSSTRAIHPQHPAANS
jgi:hypothetical protein